MEEDQEVKHMCKFCYKVFPCGRSLGGHMRSHLINISSSDHPKKKLPPLTNVKSNVLVNSRKKTRKLSKTSEEDTLLQDKLCCKECGKSFQSWKALFGHMKSHSVNGRALEEDSWNSSSDHHNLIMDSQSDNEGTTPLCRRKRSDRTKRYVATTSSSSLTNFEFDHQEEEEEVALSLILLSKDTGMTSIVESSSTSSELLEAKKADKMLKSSDGECLKSLKSDEGLKTGNLRVSSDELRAEKSEVNSPKDLINKSGLNQFRSDRKKIKSSKRKLIDSHDSELSASLDYKRAYGPSDSDQKSKFICIICGKNFPSYQALGGHRASHKKFKGCCAPTSENLQNKSENGNQIGRVFVEKIDKGVECKKNKDHECPICFKGFLSGQALGGHKRSHLISDPSISTKKQIPEIRNFLDLNLPAPVEEECDESKPWWINICPS
ncbi:hypothetical protein CDL12_27641 [Handroanthus impetiginosus]|uniref:C2H2-type domain-containing protein n=1 Tax=Handroanthus impetiginosus TaxID=429701 RepID=A0A2G9G3I6_9LAMI|nr:hypothetical protein CDL12_27641 [Handroanthus impetiginosus]